MRSLNTPAQKEALKIQEAILLTENIIHRSTPELTREKIMRKKFSEIVPEK